MSIRISIREKYEYKAGFSLLETIVAISILMVTIVGPLSLASKGIVFANYVKDEITAFYLAQEALEAIRNIRDMNIKKSIPESDGGWLATIKNKCMTPEGGSAPCRIDIWDFNNQDGNHGLQNCSVIGIPNAAECGRLKVADVSANADIERLYGYEFGGAGGHIIPTPKGKGAEDSIFTRKIIISKVVYSNLTSEQQNDAGLGSPNDINEINVKIEVSWFRGIIERSIQISENLFSI